MPSRRYKYPDGDAVPGKFWDSRLEPRDIEYDDASNWLAKVLEAHQSQYNFDGRHWNISFRFYKGDGYPSQQTNNFPWSWTISAGEYTFEKTGEWLKISPTPGQSKSIKVAPDGRGIVQTPLESGTFDFALVQYNDFIHKTTELRWVGKHPGYWVLDNPNTYVSKYKG